MTENDTLIDFTEFKESFSFIGEDVSTKYLYQYSHSSTVGSLLNSNCLWSTSHKNLNDPTEFNHGMKFFIERIESFLAQISPDSFQNVKEYFLDQAKSPDFKIFIASFTPNKDLLSQWRGYGDNGQGFSIGFDSSHFKICEDKSSFWVKVVYDDKIKNKIVDNIFMSLLKDINKILASKHNYTPKQIIDSVLLALIQVATINSIRFKDSSWGEEEEWRLVKLHFGDKQLHAKPVKVRSRGHELIEYYEMDFTNDAGSALSEVVIGPRSNKANQKSALITMLNGYNVQLTDSVIPWL